MVQWMDNACIPCIQLKLHVFVLHIFLKWVSVSCNIRIRIAVIQETMPFYVKSTKPNNATPITHTFLISKLAFEIDFNERFSQIHQLTFPCDITETPKRKPFIRMKCAKRTHNGIVSFSKWMDLKKCVFFVTMEARKTKLFVFLVMVKQFSLHFSSDNRILHFHLD